MSRCTDHLKHMVQIDWSFVPTRPNSVTARCSSFVLSCPSYVGRIWKTELFFYTLFLNEFGAFRKRSSNRRNLKTLALRFSMDEKHFYNDNVTIVMIFNCQSFTCCSVFKFLSTENIWWVFRVKHPFSKPSGIVWMGLCYELRVLSKLLKVFQQRIASRQLV